MNGFIFNERNAVRLSAVMAGQALQKEAPTTALGRMVADQIAAGQAHRLKTKDTAGGGDPHAIVERFRRGGVR